MDEDQQAMRTLIANWHHATTARDVDAVLQLMDREVVFLVAGQAPRGIRDGDAQCRERNAC